MILLVILFPEVDFEVAETAVGSADPVVPFASAVASLAATPASPACFGASLAAYPAVILAFPAYLEASASLDPVHLAPACLVRIDPEVQTVVALQQQ